MPAGAGQSVQAAQSTAPAVVANAASRGDDLPLLAESKSPLLLLVDDEPNILKSLGRLFRNADYRLLLANSGEEGKEVIAANPDIDLIISDMRMPGINGADLLAYARDVMPDTMRILLTGHADMASTVDAINRGQIYRYISKPWDDDEVRFLVRQALEMRGMKAEKERLERLTRKQNEELAQLNSGLEKKVAARTAELQQTMSFLETAHDSLKKGFLTSIRVFSNLIELRDPNIAGHSRRVADIARAMARQMALPDADVQDVFLAGLLHDIGKIGLSDTLLKRPYSLLNAEELAQVCRHPVKGQASLMALEQLQGAAALIRSHKEKYDGTGYPDKRATDAIPIGARILAVANDFDEMQLGLTEPKKLSPADAVARIKAAAGRRYDPQVVVVFLTVVGNMQKPVATPETALTTDKLVPGMVVSRDILTRDGVLLLAKDYMLDDRLIGQIKGFEESEGRRLVVYVKNK